MISVLVWELIFTDAFHAQTNVAMLLMLIATTSIHPWIYPTLFGIAAFIIVLLFCVGFIIK